MSAPSPNSLLTETSPEVELLLCCTRIQPNRQTAQRIAQLAPRIEDWAYLLDLADRHRVIPLLYSNLNNLCRESVPAEVFEDLSGFFRMNAMHNLSMTTELMGVINLLEAQEISTIPYKGPVLTTSLYGDLALRQFGDLDIIIRKQDQMKVIEILEGEGFHLHSEVNASLDSQLKYEYHLHFQRKDGLILEVHWGFAYEFIPFPVDFDQLWDRLEPVSLAGVSMPNLSPEDLLLILCVHGFKHIWSRLSWVCDVAELLRTHPSLNWTDIFEQAQSLRCEHILLFGLKVVRDLLGAELPKEINRLIELNPAVHALAQTMDYRKLFSLEVDDPVTTDEAILSNIGLVSGWQNKIRYYLLYLLYYLNRVIPPSEKDRELVKLPRLFSVLYYLVRPIRLITTFGLRPIIPFRQIFRKIFIE